MKKSYASPAIAVINIATHHIIAASINERPGSWDNLRNNEDVSASSASPKNGEWGDLWNK